ncbi:MAG: ribulose-phosphate 3-epimerase [Chitinophagales bacterium]|nr:ribulose-phosphate 3-epimerase [Chitinophagales bacterium]
MAEVIVAPSVLACNFANLEHEFQMMNQSEAQYIHIDVMDGVFVPNISFGMPLIKTMRALTNKVLDVHLMIVQPEKYIETFATLGVNVLSVHYEACTHLHRTLQTIKENNMKAGVAINPHTPISVLEDVIQDIDLVCMMSVNPGFGGQKFIERTYDKIAALKALINERQSNTLIEIDGGVTLNNAKQLITTGADVLVAGSTVFNSSNPIQTIHQLKNIMA